VIRWHVHRAGREAGPAVLFLHGFLGSGADFDAVAAGLGVRGIAPDLPGHGQTRATRFGEHGLEACAAALLGLLDAEGADRPHLVGYSMGGRLALTLAVRARARFGRVVIVSATPGLPNAAERAARRAADRALAARAVMRPLPEFLAAWYAQPLFATLDPASPAVQAMQARRGRQDPWGLARSLRAMGTGAMRPLWDDLPQAAPFDAVAGARDAKFAAIAGRMARTPGATAHLVEGAGHAPHLEQPARFVQNLNDLLGLPGAEPSGDPR
jgi:2-succinyl-6-hydroxy-2,4-cyclohexadiene-1-carboxylate synthase